MVKRIKVLRSAEGEEHRRGIGPMEILRGMRVEGAHGDPSLWSTAQRKEVAAHLDGDGCLSIGRVKKTNTYRVSFQFTGSSMLPFYLAEDYGGFVGSGGGSFVWDVGRQKELKAMLKAIRSHVRLKRENVDVALEALKILEEKKRGWKGKLSNLKERMGELNDTGARFKKAQDHWKKVNPEGKGRPEPKER